MSGLIWRAFRALPHDSQRLSAATIAAVVVLALFEPAIASVSGFGAAVASGVSLAGIALLVTAAFAAGYEVRKPVPPSASGWGRQLEVAVLPAFGGTLSVANGGYLLGFALLACAAIPVASAVRLMVLRQPPRWRNPPSRNVMAAVMGVVSAVAGCVGLADVFLLARDEPAEITGVRNAESSWRAPEEHVVLVSTGDGRTLEVDSRALYDTAMSAGGFPQPVQIEMARITPSIVAVDHNGRRIATLNNSFAGELILACFVWLAVSLAILADQWWLRRKNAQWPNS